MKFLKKIFQNFPNFFWNFFENFLNIFWLFLNIFWKFFEYFSKIFLKKCFPPRKKILATPMVPVVYTFGEKAEIREIFSKKGKNLIFYREVYRIFLKFSWDFSKVSSLLVQPRKILQADFLAFPAWWKLFQKV